MEQTFRELGVLLSGVACGAAFMIVALVILGVWN